LIKSSLHLGIPTHNNTCTYRLLGITFLNASKAVIDGQSVDNANLET